MDPFGLPRLQHAPTNCRDFGPGRAQRRQSGSLVSDRQDRNGRSYQQQWDGRFAQGREAGWSRCGDLGRNCSEGIRTSVPIVTTRRHAGVRGAATGQFRPDSDLRDGAQRDPHRGLNRWNVRCAVLECCRYRDAAVELSAHFPSHPPRWVRIRAIERGAGRHSRPRARPGAPVPTTPLSLPARRASPSTGRCARSRARLSPLHASQRFRLACRPFLIQPVWHAARVIHWAPLHSTQRLLLGL
jgi:hypothetical protein